ncbi:MAG: hypothetical protein VB108_07400 [Anaerolineaceae bacterium]|nr:hypothetical protein [Anaerolineaceae bacterium]
MDDANLKKIVLQLVGKDAMAYAYHSEDGSLSVVDRHGKKFLFGWGDYQHLLKQKKTALVKPAGKVMGAWHV